MQTPIFFSFKAEQRYEFFLCYFLLLYFVKIYIYTYIWFFKYLKKKKNSYINYQIKLSLAIFNKIKKLAIIEIILLNVTHLFFIFLYYLVIYIYIYIYIYILMVSKQFYFFAISETACQIFCKSLHVQAMASSSNCNTN